ncbi:MAG TPA: GNAT family N-acetyltransferase [Paludibacteraceae bacterium]|nr:GNAT family N-acetyltransferase [Paludibacteraceae bacterium]HPT42860.1 GNAT family N-acetyltransferase [Paludibacteraceae bacterium]
MKVADNPATFFIFEKFKNAMLIIRPIQQSDNKSLATIIRRCFYDFGAPTAGTVYEDPTTDDLFSLFTKEKSVLWVAESDGKVLGCCGLFPDDKLPKGTVELVKFYLAASARGKGIGKALMERTIGSAREFSYQSIYIESLPEFSIAVSLYEKYGFRYLKKSLGKSTHPGCNVWMLKDL